ncbi:hypothetical protein L291_1863 [Acinetobacter guillouiae MSP4-18]|uniref:hypothetical protein n=1 Tax=Acinetobacter guillouiae TaxID=106649 RepID=UPI0002CFC64E|nr:hypothetical protein [Acinetobacter guillouiae]ENU57374.1 hypothetical protein F981_03602 [Acinetobacter guillouiae CIP 63.46]EPH35395.1 hypothetical protein L291_1863 [Acinetobacter guillouiae MSP4-18]KAB0624903.1 hypothetical protein F7P82_17090 [Acinetobacter guillouiae]
MDIKNTAITATMVIQSLVKLLENEDVDISSVKFKVGSEGDGYESPEFELEKLIDLAYEGLEKIKQQATHEGSDLRFEQEDDAVWVFNGDSQQGAEIIHLITSHIDDYNEDDVRLICHYAANEIDRLRAKLAKATPQGFVLVPKQPTPKMIDATWNFDEEIQDMSHNSRNEFIYNAMIAAAQEPTND